MEINPQTITPYLWFDSEAERPPSSRSQRAMKGMLQMKKFDVPSLERAFEGST